MRAQVLVSILVTTVLAAVGFSAPTLASADIASANTTTTVSVSPSGPVPAATELTVTISVETSSGNPMTGSVVVSVAGVALPAVDVIDGVATLVVVGSAVTPGTLELDAAFTGGDGFANSTSSIGVLVYFTDTPPMIGGEVAPFFADIRWLTGQSITSGYADEGFHPTAAVSRQAMAAFLYRAANPGTEIPVCATAPFPDVSTSNGFCGAIAWLAAQNISAGYGDGGFHPTAAVSRQAMAAFLYRFRTGQESAPACSTAPFIDVPAEGTFCGAIAWLVAQGVANGYSDGTFRSTNAVSRQAMAAFLHRLFGDAIRTLAPGTVEVSPADILSVDGQLVTVKAGVTIPPVGGILVVSTDANNGTGIFGTVLGIDTSGANLVLQLGGATLDDAYTTLHIVATNLHTVSSVSSVTPVSSGSVRAPGTSRQALHAALGSQFECDKNGVAVSADVTALTLSSFDLDIGFHAPKFSLSIDYSPSITISTSDGISVTCTLSTQIVPPILILEPPIVIETSAYGSLSFAATAGVTVTAGIHLGADIRAEGTHADTNFRHDPFASASTNDPTLSVDAEAGLQVEAKLADVVGLEGNLGLGAHLRWGGDDLGRTCLIATIGPVASLTAVLSTWVHDFEVTLLEPNLPVKEVWRHCFGGGIWSGTASQHMVGTGTLDEGVWVSHDTTDISLNFALSHNISTATISGYTSSHFVWANQDGWICHNETDTIGRGPVTKNLDNDFYALRGDIDTFWPQVGTFEYTDHTYYDDTECGGESFYTDTRTSYPPTPFMVAANWTGNSYALACDPVDYFPSNVQAIRETVTLNCTADTATAAITFVFDLVQDSCDYNIDSDGDGIGDCDEYYGGRNPNKAGS